MLSTPDLKSQGTLHGTLIQVVNVSGTRFEMSENTWAEIRKAMPETARAEVKLTGSEVFLERHAGVFQSILYHQQGGELHLPADVCPSSFKIELDFYGVDEALMAKCCFTKYVNFFDDQDVLKILEHDETEKSKETNKLVQMKARGGWSGVQAGVWLILNEPFHSRSAKVYFTISAVLVMVSLFSLVAGTHHSFHRELTIFEWQEYFGPDWDKYSYFFVPEPEVRSEPETKAEPETTGEAESEGKTEPETYPETTAEPETAAESETAGEPETEGESEAETNPENTAEPETGSETEPETAGESETEGETEPETTGEPETGSETEPETAGESETEGETEPETTGKPETESDTEAKTVPENTAEPESASETEPENTAIPESASETEPETTGEPETESETEPETTGEPETESETEPETVPENTAEPESASETEPETTGEPETESKTEAETESETTTESETSSEPETESENQPETEPKTESETEAETEPETTAEPETSSESEAESEHQPETEPETTGEPETTAEAETASKPETATDPEYSAESETSETPETEGETEPETYPETTAKPETSAESETNSEPETAALSEGAEYPEPKSGPKSEGEAEEEVPIPENAFARIDMIEYMEYICTAVFTIDLFIRVIFCPFKHQLLVSFLNWVDVFALTVVYTKYVVEALSPKEKYEASVLDIIHCLQVVRVFRLFRLVKNFTGFRVLMYAFKASFKEMMLMSMFLFIAMLLFATFAFFSGDETFTSIPDSFWWAIVTMTTVGYGDVVPKTELSRFVGILCAISGVCLIAVIIPIFVNNFMLFYMYSKVWGKKYESDQMQTKTPEIMLSDIPIKTLPELPEKSGKY